MNINHLKANSKYLFPLKIITFDILLKIKNMQYTAKRERKCKSSMRCVVLKLKMY